MDSGRRSAASGSGGQNDSDSGLPPGLFLADALNAFIGIRLQQGDVGRGELVESVLSRWPQSLRRPSRAQILKRLEALAARSLVTAVGPSGKRLGFTLEGAQAFAADAAVVKEGRRRAAAENRFPAHPLFNALA